MPAGAHAQAIDTHFGNVGVDCGSGPSPEECLYSGYIESKQKCLANRKVKMFALLNGGSTTKLADTDKTSKHGAFAGLGMPSTVSAAKFKVAPKKVGDDTCKGDSFTGA